jgi:hypothetical protein
LRHLITFTVLAAALIFVPASHAETKHVIPDYIWANKTLYNINMSPNEKLFTGARDTFMVFEGLMWQKPVAEAGHKDKNYHNGHWQVVFCEYTTEGKAAFDVNNDGISEYEITT